MFAFTKQQKAVKTLKKLSKIYSALENEKNSEKDSREVCTLKDEKRDIDKEKIAIHYDALKLEIENFTVINSFKEMWKIEKPSKAEGMVFEVDFSAASKHGTLFVDTSTFSVPIRAVIDDYNRAIEGSLDMTNNMGLAKFFSTAIYQKIKRDEIEKRKTYWKDLTGEDYLPSIPLYVVSTLMKTQKDILYLNRNLIISLEEMSLLAKYHKINIGIIK